MNILLIEDNEGDRRIMEEAFKSASIDKVSMVEDGLKAMAYLRQEAPYSHVSRPDLILLDLNLPKKDGREVLAEIKKDPVLRNIPVIVLTSSNSQKDICASYDLAASCYVTKPFGFTEVLNLVKSIKDFWLTRVSYCYKSPSLN